VHLALGAARTVEMVEVRRETGAERHRYAASRKAEADALPQ
jgi:hypothetical protein